jgi:hypothetical protein
LLATAAAKWSNSMSSQVLADLVQSAESLYDRELRAKLDPSHRDEFVAIEPISREYFLGKTLSEALRAARTAHPDRLSHTMRVGHQAALHFGVNIA